MGRPLMKGRIVLAILAILLVSGALIAFAQDTGNPAPPLTGTITYTVKAGDVVDLIAARYDVSADCLISENKLDKPGHIFVGNTLTISTDCPFYTGSAPVPFPREGHVLGAPAQALTTTVNGGQTYTVQLNDTLDTIAQRLNISEQALAAANGNPKATRLKVGTALIVPAGAPPYGAFVAVNASGDQGGGSANGRVYIVQPGDVLELIAASFNIQRSCLVERNNRKHAWFVRVGETIVLPTDCPPYDGSSIAYTPNPNGLQGSSSGPVIVATAAPTVQAPLAQMSPTPELLQPTLPPTVTPAPTVSVPTGTEQAVG